MNPDQGPLPDPGKAPDGPWSRRPAFLWAALFLAAAIHLSNSWERDFWAPEEPDFAAAVKEMEARGARGERLAFLEPTIGGEKYFEKPPLLYWSALLSSRLTGADPRLAYRLPVAIASALALGATYLAGRRLFGGKIAAAASLIQASSYLHFHCGSWLLTDALFAFGCGLAVMALGIAARWEPGSLRWALIGWGALAVAALSKSALLAPALVLPPIVAFILLDPGEVERAEVGRGGPGALSRLLSRLLRLRPVAGCAVFLALVAPWYAAMVYRNGPGFLEEHFFDQHLNRLVEAESHQRPFFHYLGTLPLDFLPWSVFLPLAVFHGKAHFRRPAPRLVLIWALWTFLFLSAISSKQGKYLLPMWPALSLLVASGLLSAERESIWEGFLGEGVLRGLAWALGAPLILAAGAALFWFSGLAGRFSLDSAREVLAGSWTAIEWTVLGLLSGAGFLAAGIAIHRRLQAGDLQTAVVCLSGATLFSYLAVSFTYDDLNRIKSARQLCEEASRAAGDGPLALYGRNRAAVHYYLDRPLIHIPHLDPLQSGSEAERRLDAFLGSILEAFLIIGNDDLRKLLERFPKYRDRLHPVREGLRFGHHRRATLVSNRRSAQG